MHFANTTEYLLPNGMRVILAPRPGPSLVSSNIWYRAGSANDPPGKTGLAHLFEHMMFQGSKNVGKGEHFQRVQQAGGRLNASTAIDRTNYYQKVPEDYLELILMLEADRMGYFLPALDQDKLKNQIDVVSNERLEHYDNQPYGLAFEKMLALCYAPGHPYASPVIGSLEHIQGFTIDDVSAFFRQHYSPSNATLVIAGDFEEAATRGMIDKYFAPLPDTSAGSSGVAAPAPELLKTSGYHEYTDEVTLDKLLLAWHSCPAYAEDDVPLHMLAELLTGSKSGYLHKKLVMEEQIAQSVSSSQYSGKYGGLFYISATARNGVPLQELKEKITTLLARLPDEIQPQHIERTRNNLIAQYFYHLEDLSIFADYLNHYYYYLGVPDGMSIEIDRMNAVQPGIAAAASAKYLNGNFNELRILAPTERKGK